MRLSSSLLHVVFLLLPITLLFALGANAKDEEEEEIPQYIRNLLENIPPSYQVTGSSSTISDASSSSFVNCLSVVQLGTIGCQPKPEAFQQGAFITIMVSY